MEKNKKLVVNFDAVKRVLSTITAGVCLITLAGCAKNDDKDTLDISNPPRIEEPVESNTQDVEISSSQEIDSSSEELAESNSEVESEVEEVVDPNAPVFDIQDDEVFQSKVDELFNEIGGMSYTRDSDGWSITINEKSQIEAFLLALNLSSISPEQINSLENFGQPIDVARNFTRIVRMNADMKLTDLSKYLASPDEEKMCSMAYNILEHVDNGEELTDEDILFAQELIKTLVNDVFEEQVNAPAYHTAFMYLNQANLNYYYMHGYECAIDDIIIEYIANQLGNLSPIANEVLSDIENAMSSAKTITLN